jgi:hypothetical protein
VIIILPRHSIKYLRDVNINHITVPFNKIYSRSFVNQKRVKDTNLPSHTIFARIFLSYKYIMKFQLYNHGKSCHFLNLLILIKIKIFFLKKKKKYQSRVARFLYYILCNIIVLYFGAPNWLPELVTLKIPARIFIFIT